MVLAEEVVMVMKIITTDIPDGEVVPDVGMADINISKVLAGVEIMEVMVAVAMVVMADTAQVVMEVMALWEAVALHLQVLPRHPEAVVLLEAEAMPKPTQKQLRLI